MKYLFYLFAFYCFIVGGSDVAIGLFGNFPHIDYGITAFGLVICIGGICWIEIGKIKDL